MVHVETRGFATVKNKNNTVGHAKPYPPPYAHVPIIVVRKIKRRQYLIANCPWLPETQCSKVSESLYAQKHTSIHRDIAIKRFSFEIPQNKTDSGIDLNTSRPMLELNQCCAMTHVIHSQHI